MSALLRTANLSTDGEAHKVRFGICGCSIDELDCLGVGRGYPAVLRCDNGPELACAAMADWAGERVGLHFIPPGQPWRNGYIE